MESSRSSSTTLIARGRRAWFRSEAFRRNEALATARAWLPLSSVQVIARGEPSPSEQDRLVVRSTLKPSCFADRGGLGVDPLGPRAIECLAGRRRRRASGSTANHSADLAGSLALGGSSLDPGLGLVALLLEPIELLGLGILGLGGEHRFPELGLGVEVAEDVNDLRPGASREPVESHCPSSSSGGPGWPANRTTTLAHSARVSGAPTAVRTSCPR